ncbi:MAG: hypothetical protein KF796_01525 [Ramlibacter sp.]|nr:hypothetical protein [Ramlibacter sp.]
MRPVFRSCLRLLPYGAGLAMLGMFYQPLRTELASDSLLAIVVIVYLLLLRLAAKCVAHLLSESDSE